MSKKLVIFNGVKVTADWPAKVEGAQDLTHYTIGGEKFGRIRFGDDDPRWGAQPCRDCAALKGQFHVPHCEYEKCPACGESHAGGCSCDTVELREPGEDSSPAPGQSAMTRKLVVGLGFVLILLVVLTVWTILSCQENDVAQRCAATNGARRFY